MFDAELHQELCDHVLGQVFFGLADGRSGGAPLFCQVMDWPAETTRHLWSPLYVYVRLVEHQILSRCGTLFYWIEESRVAPRPQAPSHVLCDNWCRCRLRRRVDEATGLISYTVWYNQRCYEALRQSGSCRATSLAWHHWHIEMGIDPRKRGPCTDIDKGIDSVRLFD